MAASREVMMLEVKEISRLWLLGCRKTRLAQHLGLDVKTVRGYLAARAPGSRGRPGAAALNDELVAGVMAATQGAAGRPRGDDWTTRKGHRELVVRHLADG